MQNRPQTVSDSGSPVREPVRLDLPALKLPPLSLPATAPRITPPPTQPPAPPRPVPAQPQSVQISRPIRFQPERITTPQPEPIPLVALMLISAAAIVLVMGGVIAGSAALVGVAAACFGGIAVAASAAAVPHRVSMLGAGAASALLVLLAVAKVPAGLGGTAMLGAIFVPAVAIPAAGLLFAARMLVRRAADSSLPAAYLAHTGTPVVLVGVVAAAAVTALHSFSAHLDALIAVPIVAMVVAGLVHVVRTAGLLRH